MSELEKREVEMALQPNALWQRHESSATTMSLKGHQNSSNRDGGPKSVTSMVEVVEATLKLDDHHEEKSVSFNIISQID